jgi:hypothetical protein
MATARRATNPDGGADEEEGNISTMLNPGGYSTFWIVPEGPIVGNMP